MKTNILLHLTGLALTFSMVAAQTFSTITSSATLAAPATINTSTAQVTSLPYSLVIIAGDNDTDNNQTNPEVKTNGNKRNLMGMEVLVSGLAFVGVVAWFGL